jgi:hypothetical protein
VLGILVTFAIQILRLCFSGANVTVQTTLPSEPAGQPKISELRLLRAGFRGGGGLNGYVPITPLLLFLCKNRRIFCSGSNLGNRIGDSLAENEPMRVLEDDTLHSASKFDRYHRSSGWGLSADFSVHKILWI